MPLCRPFCTGDGQAEDAAGSYSSRRQSERKGRVSCRSQPVVASKHRSSFVRRTDRALNPSISVPAGDAPDTDGQGAVFSISTMQINGCVCVEPSSGLFVAEAEFECTYACEDYCSQFVPAGWKRTRAPLVNACSQLLQHLSPQNEDFLLHKQVHSDSPEIKLQTRSTSGAFCQWYNPSRRMATEAQRFRSGLVGAWEANEKLRTSS